MNERKVIARGSIGPVSWRVEESAFTPGKYLVSAVVIRSDNNVVDGTEWGAIERAKSLARGIVNQLTQPE